MQKKIWKYNLYLDKVNEFHWPINSCVKKFMVQGNALCIWVEHPVDENKNMADISLMKRSFKIFGTGHYIPYKTSHIDSCLDGSFVWHLYEIES